MLRFKLLTFLILCVLSFTGRADVFTVVIDPGHGGHDAGAVGSNAKEKDINLAVALKVGKLIEDNCKDVNVVYTRDNDVFIPLQSRADLANKASGDLFISIHTNSVDKKSKNYKTVAGASVYTLGFRRSEENLAVAMRENSVIKLEADYTTTYQGFDPTSSESYIIFEMSRDKHMEQSIEAASAVQNELISTAGRKDHGVRQANFWVLFKTSMPAILVELDFICNPTSEKFMTSKEGEDKLAQAIYKGFAAYKKTDDLRKSQLGMNTSDKAEVTTQPNKPQKVQVAGSSQKPTNSEPESVPTEQKKPDNKQSESQVAVSSSGTVYKIQFLVSSTKLSGSSSKLKGISDAEYYEDGGLFKYTTGSFYSQSEAQSHLPKVRKLFPDAFVIKTVDGKRVK